jgi:predicted dehydrogenase
MVRGLISGLGSIGTRHGRNFASLGVTVAGYDPDPARRQAFSGVLGGCAVYDDLDQALSDPAPDFAVIACPNSLHVPQAIACAERGIGMFIEKPLSHDLGRIDELAALVADRGVTAHVCSNFKFHPGVVALRDVVTEGRLGKVLAVQAISGQYLPDWHPKEDYRKLYAARADLGGGVLHDRQELDYLAWIFGPCRSVSCRMVTTGSLDIETEDLCQIIAEFGDGVLATVQLDYLQRPYARRIHVTGTQGIAQWDYVLNSLRVYTEQTGAWDEMPEAKMANPNDMYVAQSEHFLACLRDAATPVTGLSAACDVMRTFDACRRSAANQGRIEQVR